MSTSLEKQVWIQVGDGDKEAYAHLYVFYYKHLYNYGRKFTEDAALLEDAVQDALLSIWTGRDRLEKIEKPHPYVFSSFRYILFKKLRQAGRVRSMTEADEGEPEFGIEHLLVGKDLEMGLKRRLEEAMKSLTDRQREAIFLRFYEGLSYEEVAEVMGISVKATYKIMSRALLQLRDTMSFPILTVLLLLRTLA